MTGRDAHPPRERELWRALEALVPSAGDSRPALVSMDSRPSPFASSARLDEVDLIYEDGTRLSLMFKQLGARGLLPAARIAKPRFVHDPAREITVYRDILNGRQLGTPHFLGGLVEPRRGWYWLFLERVAGTQLRWATDEASWDLAAAWLSMFHSSMRVEAHRDGGALLAYDRDLYTRWLARARRFAVAADPSRAKSLAWIASGYHRVVDSLVALPRTVVHGQFYPSNVLVDESTPSRRVAVVDWEVAGVGPAATDLAALTAGAPSRRRQQMVNAYLAAMPSGGTSGPDRAEMELALTYARLALAIQWLGWAPRWLAPPEQATDWLKEAVELYERIR